MSLLACETTPPSELRRGQRFRTTRELTAATIIQHTVPYRSEYDVLLPEGTELVIASDPEPGAIAVRCLPIQYEAFEARFIPEAERTSPEYAGYTLILYLEARPAAAAGHSARRA